MLRLYVISLLVCATLTAPASPPLLNVGKLCGSQDNTQTLLNDNGVTCDSNGDLCKEIINYIPQLCKLENVNVTVNITEEFCDVISSKADEKEFKSTKINELNDVNLCEEYCKDSAAACRFFAALIEVQRKNQKENPFTKYGKIL